MINSSNSQMLENKGEKEKKIENTPEIKFRTIGSAKSYINLI